MQIERLSKLLEIPDLSDLVLNGAAHAFANVGGVWRQVESPFTCDEDLTHFAIETANSMKRRLDFASPFADISLNGLRYHFALPINPGARIQVSIRKHRVATLAIGQVLDSPIRWEQKLRALVENQSNFIISGGTGSGKTTLLRALLELDTNSRIITVEDVAELPITQTNSVSLVTRQANSDGAGAIDLQRLVVESLRMKPDRIVVGEVRGTELVPMLQALNSGHRGSATTIHANRAEDVPARLIGIGLLGGLSPATTAHLASAAFDSVISLGPRVRGINIQSISRFELTRESKLVTRIE